MRHIEIEAAIVQIVVETRQSWFLTSWLWCCLLCIIQHDTSVDLLHLI
jgi:hypothetical protein